MSESESESESERARERGERGLQEFEARRDLEFSERRLGLGFACADENAAQNLSQNRTHFQVQILTNFSP